MEKIEIPKVKELVKEKKIPEYMLDNMRLFLTPGCARKECLEHFAEEQLKFFIDNPRELQISAYRLTKGVAAELYVKWRKRCKSLRDVHKFLLELLAHRRQATMFDNNPNLIAHTQYQYDKGWEEADAREDERKSKIAKSQADVPTHVFFESYASVKTVEDAKTMIKNMAKKGKNV